MPTLDKQALVAAAVTQIERARDAMRASAEATREGATHEESRAENDKDTRGLEASYLARGQAMRVEEMDESITRLRTLVLRGFDPEAPIELGALVTLDVEGAEQRFFVVPVAGGTKVCVEGIEVLLVTPSSPVGRALIDKQEGDAFELRLGGRVREYEVVGVE